MGKDQIIIYHYDADQKFYIGSELYQRQKGCSLPAHSTSIKPPEKSEYADNEIPVFNGKGWDIKIDNFWRREEREINYYSGRSYTTYNPLKLNISQIPCYPIVSQICQGHLLSHYICEEINSIHRKYDLLIQIHSYVTKDVYYFLHPVPNYFFTSQDYHFMAKNLVAEMRDVIDKLIMGTYLLANKEQCTINKKMVRKQYGCHEK